MQSNYDPRYPEYQPSASAYGAPAASGYPQASQAQPHGAVVSGPDSYGAAPVAQHFASAFAYPLTPPAPADVFVAARPDAYAWAPPPCNAPPAPYGQPWQNPASGFAPVAPVAVNPLAAPLAAGILGSTEAAHLTDNAAALAMDLAGTLFATNLAGKINGVNLAGGGFAIGGSFVPTAACRLEVLGPCDASNTTWFVRSHQMVGAAANIAVGGGLAVVGGGAMAGAAWEDAWTYVAVVPTEVARALVPEAEHGTLVRMLDSIAGNALVRWPDFAQLDNLKPGEATRTTHMRQGTVGIVVSTMLQNGLGYMTLSGTRERLAWRSSERFLEISDAVTRVSECGVAAGMSVLEKIDMRRESTHATRVTLRFDLHHPGARALAAQIVQQRADFPFSLAPKQQGTWTERFFHDLPAGIEAVKLEAVEQTRNHVGGGLLDSVAKYLKASGLGLSFDAMHDKRQEIDAVGVLHADTTAHLAQVGVLWLGTGSRLVFVNAQYGQLHGQKEPVFLGLVLGMQYEITKVRGTNRNGFVEEFNDAFGTAIPEFEKIASHSGYYVSVRRLLSAADLERLTTLDAQRLAQIGVTDAKRVSKLLRLRDLLHGAHAQSSAGAQHSGATGGFQPLLLADAAQNGALTAGDPPGVGGDADALAIARARVMQEEIAGIKTLGALCRWLGSAPQNLQVCVRHGACEKPIEAMRKFRLEYSGPAAQVSAGDSVAQVRRRFEQADKLRSQLDRGLEALHKDVLGNALAAGGNATVGETLLQAYIDVDHAIDLDQLTPRQKIALIRQDAIFELLPPVARAHALCLYDAHGFGEIDADARARVYRALDDEQKRITRLSVPANLQRLRAAQLELVAEARDALNRSYVNGAARTWGIPGPIALRDDRLQAARAAAAQGDPLCKLAAYDIHFLVQDNAKMAGHDDEVRAAIAAFANVVHRYDPQGVIDVTFLNESLMHMPSRRLFGDDDIRNLRWNTQGTHAMVGNALEGALETFVTGARSQPASKYAAYIVLTTGAMQDPKVVVDALRRAQESVVGFEDEVCVGFLQLKNDRRDGTGIVAGLDVHPEVGHLIEADTQVDLPVAARVHPLLTGMLNRESDAANNTRNKANAVKDTLHRLTRWQWKS